jgi:hypothetical protein
VLAAIVSLLENPDSGIQKTAARALTHVAGLANIETAESFLQSLKKTGDEETGFLSTLSLALMKPDRINLNSSETTRSMQPELRNPLTDFQTRHEEKNAALLLEGLDELDKKIQIDILPEFARFPSPLILSKLMELEQKDDIETRTAALISLGKNRTPGALSRLQAVAGDPQESFPMRVEAIHALGYSDSESAVDFLTQLAKQEPYLINAIYAALDRLASPRALTFLEGGLKQQDQRHQRWRQKRSTWRDEFFDDNHQEQRNSWEEELKVLQPNPPLETWFARQIARQDPERAAELLRHDLYAVRQGAWLGIAQSGDADTVGWLIEQHAEEDNPLFRYALYRAIDRLLLRLEVVGSAEDLKTLDSLRQQWSQMLEKDETPKSEWSTRRRVQQTILERIDWTIPVLQSRVSG